jgi:hypothetical protein
MMSESFVDGVEWERERVTNARLTSRAISEHWDIPAKMRGELVDRLGQIVKDSAASHRAVVSAARGLLAASKINLEGVRTALVAQDREELEGRITALERRDRELEEQQAGVSHYQRIH